MEEKVNRRNFLKTAGLGLLAPSLLPERSSARQFYGGSPDKDLRFSYDKGKGTVTYADFIFFAKALKSVVAESLGSPVDSEILTYRDLPELFDPKDTTQASLETEAVLRNKETRSIDDMTQQLWDGSGRVDLNLTIKSPEARESSRVSMEYIRYKGNKLFFFGQGLDYNTKKAITERFYSLAQYQIGKG